MYEIRGRSRKREKREHVLLFCFSAKPVSAYFGDPQRLAGCLSVTRLRFVQMRSCYRHVATPPPTTSDCISEICKLEAMV